MSTTRPARRNRIRFAIEQVIGRGDLAAIADVFSKTYVAHAGDKTYRGHQFLRRFVRQIRAAIPDIKVVKVAFLVESSDTIAWRRTMRGTHKKSLKGIPPSGRRVTWDELVVTRFDGDKIVEEWVVSELAGQLMVRLKRLI